MKLTTAKLAGANVILLVTLTLSPASLLHAAPAQKQNAAPVQAPAAKRATTTLPPYNGTTCPSPLWGPEEAKGFTGAGALTGQTSSHQIYVHNYTGYTTTEVIVFVRQTPPGTPIQFTLGGVAMVGTTWGGADASYSRRVPIGYYNFAITGGSPAAPIQLEYMLCYNKFPFTQFAPTPTPGSPTATRPAPTATLLAPTATRPPPTPTPPSVITRTPPAVTVTPPLPTRTTVPTRTPAPTATLVVPTATVPPTLTPTPVPTIPPVVAAPPPCDYVVSVSADLNNVKAKNVNGVAVGCPDLEQPFGTPLNVVLRKPFPRTLVTLDTTFELAPAPVPQTAWSAPKTPATTLGFIDGNGLPTAAGVMRNYQIGSKIQRLEGGVIWPPASAHPPVISSTWQFEDRGWNTTAQFPAMQYGDDTRHFVYDTSSFGLNKKGRAFDFTTGAPSTSDFSLPAYWLKLKTPWGYMYNLKWEESERNNCDGANMLTATDSKTGFTTDGCPVGQAAPIAAGFHWIDRSLYPLNTGAALDLTLYGNADAYRWHEKAQQCGEFAATRYCDPVDTQMWVPVLEVQTVQKPR